MQMNGYAVHDVRLIGPKGATGVAGCPGGSSGDSDMWQVVQSGYDNGVRWAFYAYHFEGKSLDYIDDYTVGDICTTEFALGVEHVVEYLLETGEEPVIRVI